MSSYLGDLVIKQKNVMKLRSFELKDYIEDLKKKQNKHNLTYEEQEWLDRAIDEREMRKSARVWTPEKDREKYYEEERMNNGKMKNVEKVAEGFIEWLVFNNYLTEDEAEEDYSEIVTDFQEAYEVAPKLVSLLRSISDM